uniref:Uncharacterized protein n=1 Tax=Hordeum vulgare subsp. vulgare TaxID=112509 RepID=A0A8I6X1E1_HORVV
MFKCHYTVRVWNLIYVWLGRQSVTPSWHDLHQVKQWWNLGKGQPRYSRKVINSLQMLICWEIWNERNARVFRNKASLSTRVVAKIREGAKTWVVAGFLA